MHYVKRISRVGRSAHNRVMFAITVGGVRLNVSTTGNGKSADSGLFGHVLAREGAALTVLAEEHGWTQADLDGLEADFPSRFTGLRALAAETAARLSDLTPTPAAVRRWLRTWKATMPIIVGSQGDYDPRQEYAKARTLVTMFVGAAGGDHDLALAAATAGIGPRELAAGLADGTLHRDAVLVLAALTE